MIRVKIKNTNTNIKFINKLLLNNKTINIFKIKINVNEIIFNTNDINYLIDLLGDELCNYGFNPGF